MTWDGNDFTARRSSRAGGSGQRVLLPCDIGRATSPRPSTVPQRYGGELSGSGAGDDEPELRGRPVLGGQVTEARPARRILPRQCALIGFLTETLGLAEPEMPPRWRCRSSRRILARPHVPSSVH